jgi:repressor LexA
MKNFEKLSERQRNILRFMDRYMELHGFPPTIREIGEATAINSTSVVNYNLNKLVAAGYLSREDRVSRGLRVVATFPGAKPKLVKAAQAALRIPFVGQIVASEPVSIPEDAGYYYDQDDMIEVTPNLLGGFEPEEVFALKVKGNSMIDALIGDGDTVLMHRQDTADNGDMVAVWLSERGETTLKIFYNEGERIRLQPRNTAMAPIYVKPEYCHIQGRVLSVVRYLS